MAYVDSSGMKGIERYKAASQFWDKKIDEIFDAGKKEGGELERLIEDCGDNFGRLQYNPILKAYGAFPNVDWIKKNPTYISWRNDPLSAVRALRELLK